MKNILIIGNSEEVRKKLRDCLQEIFQVYMCPLKQEDVKTMIEVIKPQLLLLCELGTGEEELENFSCCYRSLEVPLRSGIRGIREGLMKHMPMWNADVMDCCTICCMRINRVLFVLAGMKIRILFFIICQFNYIISVEMI